MNTKCTKAFPVNFVTCKIIIRNDILVNYQYIHEHIVIRTASAHTQKHTYKHLYGIHTVDTNGVPKTFAFAILKRSSIVVMPQIDFAIFRALFTLTLSLSVPVCLCLSLRLVRSSSVILSSLLAVCLFLI